MNKNISEEIKDLELLREGYRSTISHARNLLTNNLYFERTRTWLEMQVALFQKQLDALLYEHAHGEETIEHSQHKVNELNQKIKLMKHRKKIEKLIALQKEINDAKENDQ